MRFETIALDMHRAGFFVKSRALPDHMVAVMEARPGVCEQRAQPLLALDQRPRPQILAVEVEKIEQKENQRCRVDAIRSKLDDVEHGDAIVAHAAQFAVEVGLARIEFGHGFGDRRILICPVEACPGE